MRTIEAETINEAAVITRDETALLARSGNYEQVRFNAMKHGILSKLAVLAHEDHAEFDDLLAALMDEHRPGGITERHLIEELATIIWRKRRVLQAEGANIHQGLRGAARNAESVIPAAAPFESGLSGEGTDLRDTLMLTAGAVVERHRHARENLDATQKAATILRRGGAKAYGNALRALPPESRTSWLQCVENEEYPETTDALAEFIHIELEPVCINAEREARHHEAIKAQTLGEGLQIHRLDNLARYETHLDRKFERTLAMFLKLTEIRKGS